MTQRITLVTIVLVSLLVSGCVGKQMKLNPGNPVYGLKSAFEEHYGWFITSNERKNGYAAGYCKGATEAIRPFDEIDMLDEFHRFEKCFWHLRDTDRNTPNNEFKEMIDKRIADIDGEVLFGQTDIPGTRFATHGGLRGDMAHVYLFFGMPHRKAKIEEGVYHIELMTWYYFDGQGKVLMRFLFYNKFGQYRVWRNHGDTAIDFVYTMEQISKRMIPSRAEAEAAWQEFIRKDTEYLFSNALFKFSDYSDIKIENGDYKKIGALDPPDPVAVSPMSNPTILGRSHISKETIIETSGYDSFIPAYLRFGSDRNHPSFLMLSVLYKHVDWRKQDDKDKKLYVANLTLSISLQNKRTKQLTEFFTRLKKEITQDEFDKRHQSGVINILPALLPHFEGEMPIQTTFGQMLEELEPGEYVVNIDLYHTLTYKIHPWREEIEIK